MGRKTLNILISFNLKTKIAHNVYVTNYIFAKKIYKFKKNPKQTVTVANRKLGAAAADGKNEKLN